MKSRFFTGLSTLSLLLFVTVIAMWVRSYFRHDSISYEHGSRYHRLDSARGGVELLSTKYRDEAFGDGRWEATSRQADARLPEDTLVNLFSAHWHGEVRSLVGTNWGYWRLGFPYTYIALIMLATPMTWVVLYVRKRRRHAGLCPSCNYDLRATPDRCPECGTVPASPSP